MSGSSRSSSSLLRGLILFLPLLVGGTAHAAGVGPVLPTGSTWEAVDNGDFEDGSQGWQQQASYTGGVIRSNQLRAHSGNYFAQLGTAVPGESSASIKQAVMLRDGGAELTFYLRIPTGTEGGPDRLTVLVDNIVVDAIPEDSSRFEELNYRLATYDLSAFADGAGHLLEFKSRSYAGSLGTEFLVDDVSVETSGELLLADFSWTPQVPQVGEEVQLVDQSSGSPIDWQWFIGTDTYSGSTCSHTFQQPGDHEVILTVVNAAGATDSVHKVISVQPALELNAFFSWEPQLPAAGEEVQFHDQSTGSVQEWLWEFGDGTTSAEQHPIHVFAAPGTYNVKLTVSDEAANLIAELTQPVEVLPATGIVADFSWAPVFPREGEEVAFHDESQGDVEQWLWDFGDGGSSGEQHPIHVYTAHGIYQVTLTTSGTDASTDSATVTHAVEVRRGLVADFTWSPHAPQAGEEVQLEDLSRGDPVAWQWEVDNLLISQEQHPVHIFADAGSYQVKLTIFGGSSSQTASTTETIVVGGVAGADFTWSPFFPQAGEEVRFSDRSGGDPIAWLWNFGDGGVSTEQNPRYLFVLPGEYPVELTVTNAAGTSTSQVHTVSVLPGLEADFTWQPQLPVADERVQFYDRSSGDPASWQWDFGDGGSSSNQQHPAHTFHRAGSYDVTLTVTDDGGKAAATVTRRVVVAQGGGAHFTWSPEVPRVGEEVRFTDRSGGDPTGWQWDFGDGGSSSQQHPRHTFDLGGTYPVTLTVLSADGSADTATREVVVLSGLLEAGFAWLPVVPIAGEPARFRDQSIGEPDWWQWDFSDGSSSSEQHPQHTFTEPGRYEVMLTIGQDSADLIAEVSQIVDVRGALVADFDWGPEAPAPGDEVRFRDASLGSPSRWRWDFGDGISSQEQHPVHVFPAPGAYLVALRISTGTGDSASVNHMVVVEEVQLVDFTWSPAEPTAGQLIQLTDHSQGSFLSWLWMLGDGTISHEQHPQHTYPDVGRYGVTLVVTDEAGMAHRLQKVITVTPAPVRAGLAVSDSRPDIGDTVLAEITGIDTVDSVEWDFGGPGCGGAEPELLCVAGNGSCLEAVYRYASHGIKVIQARVTAGGVRLHTVTRQLTVASSGSCGETPTARLTWWPVAPAEGEPIRFTDLSSGPPSSWSWDFGDGTTSTTQHPEHLYTAAGVYTVALQVANAEGTSDTASKTLEVAAGVPVCGDGVCQEWERIWSCPQDCGGEIWGLDTLGRTSRAATEAFVPAVVGGVEGNAGTFWLTEGMVFNPGDEPVSFMLELRLDASPETPLVAGPLILQGERALIFDNLVSELFGSTATGSLRLDADGTLLLDTRTYNLTSDGTFGQGVSAIESSTVLGAGDGKVYLVGLSEGEEFRANLIVQEVSGSRVNIHLQVYANDGSPVGEVWRTLQGYETLLKRFVSLGIPAFERGYATVEVTGQGRVAVIASVVDQSSGDGATVEPVHRWQVSQATKDREEEEEHLLVAVVARSPGENESQWRSELSIQNPAESQQELQLVYYPTGGEEMTATLTIDPSQHYFSDDVVAELFPEASDSNGSLHVYSDSGVIVGSRTYNKRNDGSTLGQYLPGLGAADMVVPQEVWILSKIKSTNDFRCNVGFSEYTGEDAQVTVALFDMGGSMKRYLGSKTYDVPAYGFVQVNQVFSDIGIEGQYPTALAYVIVSSDAGAVYSYASIVDNGQDDATTVLATPKSAE